MTALGIGSLTGDIGLGGTLASIIPSQMLEQGALGAGLGTAGGMLSNWWGKGLSIFNGTSKYDLYHSVTSAENGQSVLNGIDTTKSSVENRFGQGMYLSEQPDTTLLELQYHDRSGTDTIRFSFNSIKAKVLNLTDPITADVWNYGGGQIIDDIKLIGSRAQESGYNVIRYNSERGPGENYVVFNNFEKILTPQMIVPAPRIITPIIEPTLTPSFQN